MNNKKFEVYFDCGTSKIRAGAFNKIKPKSFFCVESKFFSNHDILDSEIQQIVSNLEEKTKEYLDDVNLMIDGGELPPVLPRYDISFSETGIIDLPNDTDPIFLNVANRYTHVVAENGDFIPILIQDNYTVDQITHVKKVLESFLVDIPNSDWGSNKAMISNAIGA